MRATLLTVALATLFSLAFAGANQGHGVKTFPVEEMSSLGDKLLALARMLKRPPKPVFLHAYGPEVLCAPHIHVGPGMVALIFHDVLNGYSAKYFPYMSLAAQYAQSYGPCATNNRAESKGGSLSLKYVATMYENQLSLPQKNLFLMLTQDNANAIIDMDDSAYAMQGLVSVMRCDCYEPDAFLSDYLGSVVGRGKNRVEARRDARSKCPVPTSGDPFTGPDRPVVVCEHSYLTDTPLAPPAY